MQFLYTGASSFQAQQNDSNLSIGGFISSTIVANNALNNLFSDLSYQTIQQRKTECKALILKNNLLVTASDIIFGCKYQSDLYKIEVAFVQINSGTPNQIEKIPNAESLPYYADFIHANIEVENEIDNSVNIGDLLSGESIAVWFKRSIIGTVNQEPEFDTIEQKIQYWKDLSSPTNDHSKLIQVSIQYTIPD